MMLVSLEEAKAELHMTHDSDDLLIAQKVLSATAAVLVYLQVPDVSAVPATALEAAKQATLMLVREFYEGHDGDRLETVGEQFGYGYLPRPVVSLLYPHRQPVMA